MIIPVYNVASYLRRCFDSVLGQTFDDFEVIVVDDGSSDGSAEIIREYTEAHDQFSSLRFEKNIGNGPARNAALAASRGEFISFMDSDDYVEPHFLARLYGEMTAQRADIVMCQYDILRPSGSVLFRHPGRNETPTSKSALSRLYRDMSVHHFLWNKLYRRTLFEETGFELPAMIFEDIASVHILFHQAKKIVFIKDILYHYCQRSTSLYYTIHTRRLDDNVRALTLIRQYLSGRKLLGEYRAPFNFSVTRTMVTMTIDIAAMHIQKRLRGVRGDWVKYWGWLSSLYVPRAEKEDEELTAEG